jgi:hypothetical protein
MSKFNQVIRQKFKQTHKKPFDYDFVLMLIWKIAVEHVLAIILEQPV